MDKKPTLGSDLLEWVRHRGRRTGLVVLFAIMIVSSANAQSTLALQEKCAEGAKKFFFVNIQTYGGKWGRFIDEKGIGFNNFTSHYNKRLDKCFIRIGYSYISTDPTDMGESDIDATDIWNVFEGTMVGELSAPVKSRLLGCRVGGKTCKSAEEFEALIKPYMEE